MVVRWFIWYVITSYSYGDGYDGGQNHMADDLRFPRLVASQLRACISSCARAGLTYLNIQHLVFTVALGDSDTSNSCGMAMVMVI